MSEEEYNFYEEDEWKEERGAFERTGVGRGTEIEGRGYLQQLQRQLRQEQGDPTEFIESLLAEMRNEYYRIGDRQFPLITLSESEVNFFKEKLTVIPSLGMKNPIGLIFGFYVNTPTGISRTRLKNVETAMEQPQFIEYFRFVKPHDIIRYARLWETVV